MRRTAVLLFALLAVVAVTSLPAAQAAPRKPFVVGGSPITIESAPYQVYFRFGNEAACGGSILGPTTILLAAHCVVAPGQTLPRPVADMTVVAGATDVSTWAPGNPPPAGAQAIGVAGVRVHPLYNLDTKTDDVAVLTLKSPLNLSGPRAKAIALAPPNGGPPSGAPVGLTGYGMQVEGTPPDGKLYGGAMTAISDDQCRANLVVNASAGVLCVAAGRPASCFGDSGGPLTANGAQVGIASFAPQNGCGNGPAGFADVTSPEVRAFIDGAANVPVAPRQGEPAAIFALTPPIQGSPMTCKPGTWTGVEAFTFAFVNDANGAVLQAGPSARFVPAVAHRGATVACVVMAGNGGGTTTARSGTTAAVQPDLVPPGSQLRSVRCRNRRCTVKFFAFDRNSQGKLNIRVTAERRVRGRCGKGRKRHACTKTRAKKFKVRHGKGTRFRATRSKLRRGPVRIRVRVVDAAGNRRKPDVTKRVVVG